MIFRLLVLLCALTIGAPAAFAADISSTTTLEAMDAGAAGATSTPQMDASCAANAAYAAQGNTFGSIVNALIQPFNSATQTISSAASSVASRMMGGARVLGGILALSYFFWSVVRFLADGDDNFMGVLMETGIPVGVAAAALANYSTLTGPSGLQGIFVSMMQAATGGATLSTAVTGFANALFHGIQNAFVSALGATACVGLFRTSVAVLLDTFVTLLCIVGAAVLGVIALAELVGVLFTGIVLAGVGVAVGPWFLVCGVTPWTRGLMDGWVKFLAAALFYQTLISVMLKLVTDVITTATASAMSIASGSTGIQIGSAFAMVGIVWVIRHLFQGVPGIAHALIGGGHARAPSFNTASAALAGAAIGAMRGLRGDGGGGGGGSSSVDGDGGNGNATGTSGAGVPSSVGGAAGTAGVVAAHPAFDAAASLNTTTGSASSSAEFSSSSATSVTDRASFVTPQDAAGDPPEVMDAPSENPGHAKIERPSFRPSSLDT